MKSAFWVALNIGFVTVACSVSPAINAGTQNDAGACTQAGSTACNGTLNALCTRWVQCCSAPGAGACQSWATSVSNCQAYWVGQGYDCSSPTYADMDVCFDTTSACVADIPLVSCADMYGATANWPASCTKFWEQFPQPASTVAPPASSTPGADAGPAANTGDDSCAESGEAACDDALTALCNRWVQCCDAADAPECQSWATHLDQCREYWVGQGYDCTSATYADVDVCASETTACENDIPLIACSDMYGATANWPASCTTFWHQFK